MGKIAKLPPLVVNQIAAGEVIERPASVVKELVENSIDAGAAHVDVNIEEGGRRLIEVVDDGAGIPPEDLPMALESHATSKLNQADDLFRVATLGFRGEALASVASVSQMEITSRVRGTDFGASIRAEGGKTSTPSPKGAPEGTKVTVENLFFNTPVRRKFMKTDSTEIGHISDVVTKIALAHPGVGFSLRHNGRKVFKTPPSESVSERIAALFGRELAGSLMPAEESGDGLSVSVFTAPPEHARASKKMQYLFVNGRSVRDRSVFYALSEAYSGFLPIGRYPVAFIFIEVDPAEVDVNVHPTKIEVRFKNARRVYNIVRAIIREQLTSSRPGTPVGTSSLIAGLPEDPSRRERIERLVGEYMHRERAAEQASLGLRPGWGGGRGAVPYDPAPSAEPVPETGEFPDNFFQVHDSYIIVETDEGVDIIDQHALHERILYNELKIRFENRRLGTQNLLVPEVVDLEPAARAAMEEYGGLIREFGFAIEDFGHGSVSISAVPQILDRAPAGEIVCELLSELRDTPDEAEFKGKPVEKMLKVMSCKAAVKAGQKLSRGEIIALLERGREITGRLTCPHGRPATITITLSDLEKQFHRK